jgi:hypothetical protein
MAFIERMNGQDYIDRSREYLDYLENHLNNVKRAFDELSRACEGMMWVGNDFAWHTLRVEVENHDLSKFSKEEFVQYRDSFFPVKTTDKKNSGMDSAWENHKQKNHHHHETAENYMDIVHMVIDWTAMGYKFGDTAQEYYERNRNKINLSSNHKRFMYEIFDKIKKYNGR